MNSDKIIDFGFKVFLWLTVPAMLISTVVALYVALWYAVTNVL